MSLESIKSKWNNLSGFQQKAVKSIMGIGIGAIAGFTYYSLVGCSTGACPITSNPWISTAWGAGMGGFWALG